MAEVFYGIGEALLILALVGLMSVLVWMATTVLRVKNSIIGNAGRLYKRPLNVGKNLVATGKGIAQQETIRAKRVASKVKHTAAAVKGSALAIRGAAQTVYPEELTPAVSMFGNASKLVALASSLSQSAAKQGLSR